MLFRSKERQREAGTIPLSTRTQVRFCVTEEDVRQVVKHVQATKYAFIDVETFPRDENVPKNLRAEWNTTFFRALCRTIQISHQAGAAWVIPVYDRESPFNIGCDDVLEIGRKKGEEVIFVPISPDRSDMSLSSYSFVKKNGEVITTYDGDSIEFESQFLTALINNFWICKERGTKNFFRDICIPILQKEIGRASCRERV